MLGDYADTLRDVASRARHATILVAVEDHEVLGTVTYVRDTGSPLARQRNDDEASIRMLAVTPKRKREGIGRALSLACIERARADGKRAVVLHADEIMLASRALYEKLGFRREPSRDYAPDEDTMLLAYVLDL
jgi:ribosomal protein S18 acetylase RimI-like enzyme